MIETTSTTATHYTTDLSVAETILAQLGGSRFIAMTGARGFVGGKNYLRFILPNAADGINRVSIGLNKFDTYDVTFSRVWGVNSTPKACVDGVYVGELRQVFERHTGLATNL